MKTRTQKQTKGESTDSNKKLWYIVIVAFAAALSSQLLAGCGVKTQIQDIQGYMTEIQDITVDENVKIIGLGEATHGNVEFQELKKDVFEAVMNNNDCRVFAMEGDFGGGLKINEYIHGGEGSAKEAVEDIGFALYRTAQMEELIQWMRDYNDIVPTQEQISFYGFDMQRYDNTKEILLNYLKQVGNANCDTYQDGLTDLNDATVYDQEDSVIKKALSVATELQAELTSKRDDYIAKSDEKSYEIACECINAIIQNATLQTSSDYGNLRDGYMKERVDWIYQSEGEQKLFVTAHCGHIEKSGAVKTYVSMGKRLADAYGDDYFAIGTDMIEGEVNVVTSAGERKNVAIKAGNDITALFEDRGNGEEQDDNIIYLNYQKAAENDDLQKLLDKKHSMVSIGSTLDDFQKSVKVFFTLNMSPSKGYDSLIIVKHVTPTAPWEIKE